MTRVVGTTAEVVTRTEVETDVVSVTGDETTVGTVTVAMEVLTLVDVDRPTEAEITSVGVWLMIVGTATEVGVEMRVVRVERTVVGTATSVVWVLKLVRVLTRVMGTANVVGIVTESLNVEMIVVRDTMLVETARVVVPGNKVKVVGVGAAVGAKVSVAGDCGNNVVVAVGKTVSVVDTPLPFAGATVKVATTPGSNVVGDTGCKVKVVATKGIVVGTTGDTVCKVSVATDSGTKVVICEGTNVIVDDAWPGFAGARVRVCGTLGNSVVVKIGWTVRVVTTKGIEDGAVVGSASVRVAGADVPKVVACDGTITTAVEGSLEMTGAKVRVASTLGSRVVGEMGWRVSVVNARGIVLGSSGALVSVVDGSGNGISVVSTGTLAEAETDAVSVILASGRSVIAAVGIKVTVVLDSAEFSGGKVKVAGRFACRVVVSSGCTVTVVSPGRSREAERDATSVTLASGSSVVSAVGISVTVTLCSAGFAGGSVNVAGTFGDSVVVSSGNNVTVVSPSGSRDAEAEAETLKVSVSAGKRVVSWLGRITTVVGSSPGCCPGIVTDAGRFGSKVVGLASAGSVKVVTCKDGRDREAAAETDTSSVTVASGNSVVTSLGTTTTVVTAPAGSCGWRVMVAGVLGNSVVGRAFAGRVNVVGTSDSTGSETEAEAETPRVTVAWGRRVTSSVGRTVMVEGASLGGWIVTTAGRSAGNVVGSKFEGRVKVVSTSGSDSIGTVLDAETETPRVIVASGNSVVSSVGTKVTVVGASRGSSGGTVTVAGMLGGRMLGSWFGGKVNVVSTRGTEFGRVVSTAGTVRVNDASGLRVVACVGISVTVSGSTDGSCALIVNVAATLGVRTVGSMFDGKMTVVITRGSVDGRSSSIVGTVRVA